MALVDQIQAFVGEQAGYRQPLPEEASLQEDVGLYADDLHEFMDEFAKRFHVDMSSYLWYFHTGEEGLNPGALFFAPPQARVPEIPITLRLLREAAELGRWPLTYPPHSLPARRYDILISQLLIGGFAVAMLWQLARALF